MCLLFNYLMCFFFWGVKKSNILVRTCHTAFLLAMDLTVDQAFNQLALCLLASAGSNHSHCLFFSSVAG